MKLKIGQCYFVRTAWITESGRLHVFIRDGRATEPRRKDGAA